MLYYNVISLYVSKLTLPFSPMALASSSVSSERRATGTAVLAIFVFTKKIGMDGYFNFTP